MRSVTGDLPHIPARLRDAAAAHATRLRRQVMSDDLFLLAVLELDAAEPARRALESEGITAERLLDDIHVERDGSPDEPAGLRYSPRCYTVQGRAEGFAGALGAGPITPAHVLLALLWDPESMSSHLLWRLGVDRARVIERLRELHVPLPAAALPRQQEIEWGQKVWFERDRVAVVLDHVRLHLPPQTRWGFNYEGDRAWAIAEAQVDLEDLVAGAPATQ